MSDFNIDLSNMHSENISVTPNETITQKKDPHEMTTTTSAIKKQETKKNPIFSYEEQKKEYERKKVAAEKRLTRDPVSTKRLSGQPQQQQTSIRKPKTSIGASNISNSTNQ